MKMLGVVRDVVVIVGVLLMCWLVVDARRERGREKLAQLVATRAAITQLEKGYQQAVYDSTENKGIYQQIFRQNEVLLEYVKLAPAT
jgi:hypothetical protein